MYALMVLSVTSLFDVNVVLVLWHGLYRDGESDWLIKCAHMRINAHVLIIMQIGRIIDIYAVCRIKDPFIGQAGR